MDRLAELKKSLLELSSDEQIALIEERRRERLTLPERKTTVARAKKKPNKSKTTTKRSNKKNISMLLSELSVEEISALADELVAKIKK